MDIEKFKADHLTILGGIDHLRGLSRQGAPAGGQIASALVKFATTIRLHLAAEDRFLYPRLRQSGHPQIVALSQRFQEEMSTLADEFTGFVAAWNTGAKVSRDIDGFRQAANVTIRRVWERLRREDRELYPHLGAL